MLGCDGAVRIFEKRAIEWPFAIQDLIDQPEIMIQVTDRLRLETGKQSERFLQVIQTFCCFRIFPMLRHKPVDLALRAVLSPRQRIELGLRDNHLFIRPAHGDELTDKRNLQFAFRFSVFFCARMFGEPMREGIKQTKVSIHVLVFDERATHDDLRN